MSDPVLRQARASNIRAPKPMSQRKALRAQSHFEDTTLEKTRYNKTAAAKLLGMSFRAQRYPIKKLGIE